MSIKELLKTFDGSRFQKGFGDLVRLIKPAVVVETGVMNGNATTHTLDALDDVGKGMLYSVDPEPGGAFLRKINHPRWKLFREKSITALGKIYKESGPWDVFLHDSDHAVGCMAFELELAYWLSSQGAIIATDDHDWGEDGVWYAFLDRHGFEKSNEIGSVRWVAKKKSDQKPKGLDEAMAVASEVSDSECRRVGIRPYLKTINESPETYLVDVG